MSGPARPGVTTLKLARLATSVAIYATLAAGFAAGWTSASHPKLETFKVLNIVGLAYDLMGVIVLSELVAQSSGVKDFMVRRVARAVMAVQMFLPMGAGVGVLFNFGAPSATPAMALFSSLALWSLVPFLVFDKLVVWPVFSRFEDITLRSRVFGLTLLLVGGIVQLVAAFKDLGP